MSHLFRPLFRLDPGWPFVLAGLALLVAAVLIPAQRELHELRNELRKVESDEARVFARLEAYDRFLNDYKASDPELLRRLASAQLNLVPRGEDSLLLTPGMNQTVAQWIDESVPRVSPVPESYPDTLLARFAVGPNRLWMIASAAFLLFVGFLLGPDGGRATLPPVEPDDGREPDAAVPSGGGVATLEDVIAARVTGAGLGDHSPADSAFDPLDTAEDGVELESDRLGVAFVDPQCPVDDPAESLGAADRAADRIIDVEVVEDASELEAPTSATEASVDGAIDQTEACLADPVAGEAIDGELFGVVTLEEKPVLHDAATVEAGEASEQGDAIDVASLVVEDEESEPLTSDLEAGSEVSNGEELVQITSSETGPQAATEPGNLPEATGAVTAELKPDAMDDLAFEPSSLEGFAHSSEGLLSTPVEQPIVAMDDSARARDAASDGEPEFDADVDESGRAARTWAFLDKVRGPDTEHIAPPASGAD